MVSSKRLASFTGELAAELCLNWIVCQPIIVQACNEKSCEKCAQPCQEGSGRCEHQHT